MIHFLRPVFILLILFSACPAGISAAAQAQTKNVYLRKMLVRERTGILKTARKMLGIPYRLGGDSPLTGMDCSGFVYRVFRDNGYAMPRATDAQALPGDPNRSPLPGDALVFRGNGASGRHTAIYFGKGWFIHSPGTGRRITFDKMDSPYYRGRYLGSWSPVVLLRGTHAGWRKFEKLLSAF
jgi:hypothetical protein